MTALTRAALIEVITGVMEREGGRLAEWHGWRCAYPDRYGECNCNQAVAADIAAEVFRALLEADDA